MSEELMRIWKVMWIILFGKLNRLSQWLMVGHTLIPRLVQGLYKL